MTATPRRDTPHGIPTVLDGAVPHTIEANAHRADTRLFLTGLEAAAEIIAPTLLDVLQ